MNGMRLAAEAARPLDAIPDAHEAQAQIRAYARLTRRRVLCLAAVALLIVASLLFPLYYMAVSWAVSVRLWRLRRRAGRYVPGGTTT